MALLLTASVGTFGVAALSAGAAHAVTDSCNPNACTPVIVVDPMAADGSVHVTYTDPSSDLESVDPNSVSLTITWSPQGAVPGSAPSPNPTTIRLTNANGTCSGTGPVTCDYPFPSALKVAGFALNGTYQLSASAQDCKAAILGCSHSTQTKSTTLAIPASTPGGVKADLLPDKSGVKISWAANPEPDVFAYRVLRSDGSEACNNLLTPTDLSCSDTSSGGGTFTYRVVAIRYGADYNPKSQVASSPSSATKSVVVPGPPATTTTTITGGTLPPLTQPPFPGKPGAPKPVPGAGGGTGTFNAKPGTPAAAVAGADTPANGDTGFAPTLPYGEQPSTTLNEDPGSIAAGPVTAHKGKTSVGTIAVVGAGLLLAVIALHGLWLRSEVRRSGTLEALEPEA